MPRSVSTMPLLFLCILHTVRFSSIMFLSGAFLLGDALLLCDACTWLRFSSWRRLYLATLIAASNKEKIKAEKTKAKFFLKLVFFFYSGDLIKKPREGKKSVPLNRLLHHCLHKSTKIKFQVGCIPATQNGTTLQGL